MTHYDVAVVGAGPGGYVAAIRAAQLGKRVAVIEQKYWGGVCLNVGCIPSKALLRNAEIVHLVSRDAERFGLSGQMQASYQTAHARSRHVADGRAKGIHYLMRKNAITEIDGRAAFTGPTELAVQHADGQIATVTFEHAIIATGARPRMPSGVTVSPRVRTYEEMILDPEPPSSLVIVGAGAIGMEFAFVFNAYGTEVTIVELADRVLPLEDRDVSRVMAAAYRKLGIDIVTGASVRTVVSDEESATLCWVGADGAEHTRAAGTVLVATGFEPNTAGLGLERAGVGVDDRGAVVVDEQMRTSAPHIFAIGDVTMKLQLAHVAEAMGVVAAETLAGATTMKLGDYRMMPRATFCQPQVASFGLTEEQARAEHVDIRVATAPFSANGKAHGLGEPSGFVKLIAERDGALLGGHLVGADVAELLPELTLAQRWDLGSFELARNVHVHPTLGEAVQEALHGLEGHALNL
ncbi:dihydrolipoyl dehydrogenase [Mycolicibacterium sp.]|uniref:dihydrolipoyl dehydrogenase n=1 Tax=Mycolicibacterium sp. TaxID=2320850 RepID=UPI003D0F0A67